MHQTSLLQVNENSRTGIALIMATGIWEENSQFKYVKPKKWPCISSFLSGGVGQEALGV